MTDDGHRLALRSTPKSSEESGAPGALVEDRSSAPSNRRGKAAISRAYSACACGRSGGGVVLASGPRRQARVSGATRKRSTPSQPGRQHTQCRHVGNGLGAQ